MLIIARRKGQKIVIGDGIEIVVTDLSRTTVKLGILAPAPYAILRGEVKESIERANREALSSQLALGVGLDDPDSGVELAAVGSFSAGGVRNLPPERVNVAAESCPCPQGAPPSPGFEPDPGEGGE